MRAVLGSLIDLEESALHYCRNLGLRGISVGKKQLLIAVAAGAMALGMASAQAADVEPVAAPAVWYVSLFGGASFLDDVETDYEYNGFHNTVDAKTDTGFIVGGAIGTHLMDDLRVELEVAYSENDADEFNFEDDGGYDIEGSFGILTFMANLWYDVPLTDTMSPYIGGGAGLAVVDGDITYSPGGDGNTIYDSSEVAFAFQLGAGLRWNAFENITFDLGYRLRGVDGPTFGNTDFPNASNYDADMIISHNIIGGISVGF
jgi:opacity protein-like surface antigen